MAVVDDDDDDGDGDREGAGVGVGDEDRRRDCVGDDGGVDVGVGDDDGVAVGEGDGVGNSVGGTGDGDGDGDGRSTTGSSVGCISAVSVDCFCGVEARVRVDPGSDQSPTLSPLTKVACNRVWPCSLITGPSNFPRTILPV